MVMLAIMPVFAIVSLVFGGRYSAVLKCLLRLRLSVSIIGTIYRAIVIPKEQMISEKHP
jgi:hypothetical protein